MKLSIRTVSQITTITMTTTTMRKTMMTRLISLTHSQPDQESKIDGCYPNLSSFKVVVVNSLFWTGKRLAQAKKILMKTDSKRNRTRRRMILLNNKYSRLSITLTEKCQRNLHNINTRNQKLKMMMIFT